MTTPDSLLRVSALAGGVAMIAITLLLGSLAWQRTQPLRQVLGLSALVAFSSGIVLVGLGFAPIEAASPWPGILQLVAAIVAWLLVVMLFVARPYMMAIQSPGEVAFQLAEVARQLAESADLEQSLRKSESQLRNLLESTPDALVLVGASERIALVNSRTEQLFGYDRTQLLGQPIEMLVPASFSDGSQSGDGSASHESHLRRGSSSGMEMRGRHQSGREFPVEIMMQPIQTDEGTMVLAALRDVSERKAAEQRFRDLLESAPDAMLLIDQRGRIVLINTQAERAFGYTRVELKNHHVEQLIAPAYREPYARQRQAYFTENNGPRARGAQLELRGIRSDGREFPIEASLSPLVTRDGVLVMTAMRDVTDRKVTEELARRNERLATIGQVVTGLAHESRNALQQIQSCSAMLRRQLADRPELFQWLDGVQGAQDRLHRLLEDVRSYAAPIKLELSECDLQEVWREAWSQLGPLRSGRDAELFESLSSNERLCLMDRSRLGQVFRNVFENSLAACTDPVQVRVECECLTVEGEPRFEVRIRDNGPGFDPSTIEKLFEPFFTTKTHGTGLGMSIMRRVMDAHRGQVVIAPPAGSGAEVCLILPRGNI